jgi:hypothetical protein
VVHYNVRTLDVNLAGAVNLVCADCYVHCKGLALRLQKFYDGCGPVCQHFYIRSLQIVVYTRFLL